MRLSAPMLWLGPCLEWLISVACSAAQFTPEFEPLTIDPRDAWHALADLDTGNDWHVGPPDPLPDCAARLAAAQVRFKVARIGTSQVREGVPMCGSTQVVRFARGPGNIAYSSAPRLTCQMALALADFERVAQAEAEKIFGRRIARIDHLGTFNCRKMALHDWVSEHSFANAIDVQQFILTDGTTVNVLRDFQPTQSEAPNPRSRFLRSLSQRLFDESIFSVVLTPFFDRAHRNHLHVDLARYRVDGTRP